MKDIKLKDTDYINMHYAPGPTTIKSKKLYVTKIQQLSNMYSTVVTYNKWHFIAQRYA